ncbi:phage antirepressor KilAC domain-containing protein [Comamonas avium]|uniref:Phage antirepressor KilAC domain-containing protein n=1 Tax=Comamonas avium TaxID=2762231 RepID=A0ABR8SF95_9BURK|nr:phage antirepressor KilAC domain-containing protein [Comamonas avium]MBD7962132.1 phage antirepressor KilAC domain-containing protein [Comamonas avium]
MNVLMNTAAALTMSSLEISDLVESRHDNVKVTIERLAARGVIQLPALQEVRNHIGQIVSVYPLEKRDSYVVVAQLSPEFTARLVDRWQELEAKQGPVLPQTMAQALRMAAEQAEHIEVQEAQLREAAPKVEYVDRYVAANGAKGFRQVAKLLNANEPDFRLFLQEKKIMYRLGNEWTAYQNHIDAGRFVVKTGVATRNEHAFSTTKFTPKGVEWIAGEWAKHQVAQKVVAA